MNINNSIIILPGEIKSIFFEIFLKSLKIINLKCPILLICCKNILSKEIKKHNFKKKIEIIELNNLEKFKLKSNVINLIDIPYKKNFETKVNRNYQNDYMSKTFEVAFELIKKKISYKLLNGPINKEKFLKKKFLGMTEYISKSFNVKKTGMLIYNKNLSVSPITTHLPLKLVNKKISKKLIIQKVIIIENFYKNILKKKPKLAITGLNPHCETILNVNEDKIIVSAAVKKLEKKNINIKGPFPADTLFLKNNRKKYDVIIGMYHDQVLAPIKTLFEYNAINITMGLPFLRVSPDHGTNEKMINKNKSNPTSIIKALKFLDKH